MDKNFLIGIVSVLFVGLISFFFYEIYQTKVEQNLRLELAANQETKNNISQQAKNQKQKGVEVSNQLFIDLFSIHKKAISYDESHYISSLTEAQDISEVLSKWDKLEQEKDTNEIKILDQIKKIEEQCRMWSSCAHSKEMHRLVSDLQEWYRLSIRDPYFWFKKDQYRFFNESNREFLTKEHYTEIANAIIAPLQKNLRMKQIQIEVCPKVLPKLQTPKEYINICGEIALEEMANFENEIIERNSDVNQAVKPPSQMCEEFTDLVGGTACVELYEVYKGFHEAFMTMK